jgi:hypothetical protein
MVSKVLLHYIIVLKIVRNEEVLTCLENTNSSHINNTWWMQLAFISYAVTSAYLITEEPSPINYKYWGLCMRKNISKTTLILYTDCVL